MQVAAAEEQHDPQLSGSDAQALAWIAERRRLEPERKLGELNDEAGRRYDLSPLGQEALVTWLMRPRGD